MSKSSMKWVPLHKVKHSCQKTTYYQLNYFFFSRSPWPRDLIKTLLQIGTVGCIWEEFNDCIGRDAHLCKECQKMIPRDQPVESSDFFFHQYEL
jgi:hypothetical protein